jgi:hypothetical protein
MKEICVLFIPSNLNHYHFPCKRIVVGVKGIGREFKCWVLFKLLKGKTIEILNYPTNYELVGKS